MAERLHLLGTPAHTRAASDSAGTQPGDHRSDSAAAAPLPAERLYQLAVYLACHPSWQPREHLAALFWPELDSAAARRNLRKLLFRAGALLPTIETRADSVRWPVDTDLARFEAACRELRWAEAIELHCGPLAEGFERGAPEPYVEWLRFERNRVGALFRAAVVRRLEKLETPDARLALALRWLASEPLDEDALIVVLDALLAQQRVAEARRAYRDFAQRLATELGVEPSARVRARMARAEAEATAATGNGTPRAGDPRVLRADATFALETGADGFIGRTRELEELQALLTRPECRLLTITGPGGAGKSRLVKQALRDVAARFSDGAYWIALDDLATAAQAIARIASELSIATSANQDVQQRVSEHLSTRHVLLVLDNCEHLAGLAPMIDHLVTAAPGLRICATSRVRLGPQDEWLLPLHGLALDTPAPASAAANEPMDTGGRDPLATDAARLFIAAARAAKPGFNAAAQAPAIDALVRAVGGLPLAILLAAHWTRLLPVRHIADELAQSLDILEGTDDGEERPEHRSVRATFVQSWRHLAENEQRALAALSVFAGTFSRGAAREVAGVALPLIASLADRSLVQWHEDGAASLHPLIRQFAAEMLAQRDETTLIARRHAEYFCSVMASSGSLGADEQARRLRASSELSDMQAAFRWAQAAGRADLVAPTCGVLANFFDLTGRAAEGLVVLGATPPVPATPSRAELLAQANHASARATLLARLARFTEAYDCARLSLRASRLAADGEGVRIALSILATMSNKFGRYAESRRYSEQELRLAERAGDRLAMAASLNNLGKVESELGQWDSAIERYRSTQRIAGELGNQVGVIAALNNLGSVLVAAGRAEEALEPLRQGLQLVDHGGFSALRTYFIANLARAFAELGRPGEARRLAEEGVAAGRAASELGNVPDCLLVLARVALDEGRTDEARERLCEAAHVARKTQHTRSQMRCLLAYARWLHASTRHSEAARLVEAIVTSPGATPVDVATARAIGSSCPADDVRDDWSLDRVWNELATAGA